VRARSQYKEAQPDGTVNLVNYAIENGSFNLWKWKSISTIK